MIDRLRAYAISRSLFPEVTLARAVERLGFVQADPIRAPARAEDLTLRQRVTSYREGDLLRRYKELSLEEEHFINYGFLPQKNANLLHPRGAFRALDRASKKRATEILAFVLERGETHPREVDARFDHGNVTNYWGGSSNATTYLLHRMHDHGALRVVRRETGIRVYAVRDPINPNTKVNTRRTPSPNPSSSPVSSPSPSSTPTPRSSLSPTLTPDARARALLSLVVNLYAPLPARTLGRLAAMIRRVVPSIAKEITRALSDAKKNLPREHAGGIDFYYPEGESLPKRASAARDANADRLRFLAPFDPVVWDRDRFEIFWGWLYRFEAYTPLPKRKLGYYALPILWRGDMIGWANLSTKTGTLVADLGYVKGYAPKDRAYKRELEAEMERMRAFLRPKSKI